jgi:hypothetical protein
VNGARRRQGRFAEAGEALAAAVERLRTNVGIEAKQTRLTIAGLARVYDEWGKPEQAAEYRALLKP